MALANVDLTIHNLGLVFVSFSILGLHEFKVKSEKLKSSSAV